MFLLPQVRKMNSVCTLVQLVQPVCIRSQINIIVFLCKTDLRISDFIRTAEILAYTVRMIAGYSHNNRSINTVATEYLTNSQELTDIFFGRRIADIIRFPLMPADIINMNFLFYKLTYGRAKQLMQVPPLAQAPILCCR